MKPIDYEGASHYALARLSRELSPALIYHSLAHTLDDVLPAVERLASLEGVAGEDLVLLRTAALYHDFGFVERYLDNEIISMRIAAEALPGFGYSALHIETISGIICSTRLPQRPLTQLQAIMADADLDVLGREDYLDRNHGLRLEMAAMGFQYDDAAWYGTQYAFLASHQYFTAAARALRDAGQRLNRERMERLLRAHEAGGAGGDGRQTGRPQAGVVTPGL